ncbi:bifunctional protein-serine/threonine kinase/phosphatase [Phenylobacterium terrae]|uniref:Bifunctional protein-serine/threonine kinase/phosphatase n=1 Tax=Phenylobacterium terrae TaxID=2665495 RepID=A0ABW4MXT7_9CAUL
MEQAAQLKVQVGHATAMGPGKRLNEDFAAVQLEEPGRLAGLTAALADGVGGAKGGRVAAETAVRGFFDGYFGQSETLPVRQSAGRAIDAVSRWIHAQGCTDPQLEGMASTLTAVVLRGRRLHVLHVGDSRLYRLRDGKVARLTDDHRVPGFENALSRSIGEARIAIDYASEELLAHDRLLLCSDGVHGPLGEKRIAEALGRRGGAEASARELVDAAVAAGGQDDATALVIDVLELPAVDLTDLGQAVSALPMRQPPAAGETVDDYRLDALLADGRYSRVFRAMDRRSEQPVLLKFPKPQALGAEASARSAFLRESWVASRVASPWVGRVIEPEPGRRTCLYLVQPFYQGETLERRLSRTPIPLPAGLELSAKLCKAVAALHRAGVIHRDIKPDNVILEPEAGLKLVDLGVARLPHLEAFPAPEIPGTASYMAPELHAGGAGDVRTDVFALGVTLYRLFTGGAYPYGEIEPFSTPKLRRPAPASSHRPDLPAWLDAALARAVAPDPDERFQDAFELLSALENGALGAPPARPRPLSLYDRDPLRFWQIVSLVLLILLIASLAR